MKRIQNKIIIGLITLLAFGCSDTKNKASVNTEIDHRIKISKNQFAENGMTFTQMETKTFPVKVKVNGMIHVPPEHKADISSPMGGYIRKAPLIEGDIVKKGTFLVTLENPEFVTLQQNYMESKAQLSYLKAEYERHKIMRDENVISEKSFIKAQSDYNSIKAKYNGLKKQLQLLNISIGALESGKMTSTVNMYSPINGSVTKVNVNKGSYVSPATSILEIVDNTHIHVELSVFEKDILKIKKGQKITFSIPEASKQTYEAQVHLVGTMIEDNRTIKVHGHLLDDTVRFLPGMFVDADIITDAKSSKAILSNAIVEEDGKQIVLVLDEETKTDYYFTKKKIEIDNVSNGYSSLKQHTILKQGDKILNDGAFGLIGI
ncbi:efflux RND transporter periplasmic adaptor subunit [Winogradskyella sp.]|uniref:efflux RND transporter periplasmic adaptor subunit n=1 Tax=Winogradskyella sp. TaxID=1883156 RepID=UPI0026109D8E|nr:efflux RND transporter periplasmic adaptor subunit [Winogradskyella sp.]